MEGGKRRGERLASSSLSPFFFLSQPGTSTPGIVSCTFRVSLFSQSSLEMASDILRILHVS